METIQRRSPVEFESKPANTEMQADWSVVLEYEEEGQGPWVVDLSHRARWDFQDSEISAQQPWGMTIPEAPGQSAFKGGVLINRMNRTQASIWHLAGDNLDVPDGPAYTDVTDATLFLALLGKDVISIAEKLTSLDFLDPARETPFLLQGPFSHVPCQIATLGNTTENSGILFTCSRGYARDMTAAVLHAGAEFGLRPAGQNAFEGWLGNAMGGKVS
jgi:hypothetical protein